MKAFRHNLEKFNENTRDVKDKRKKVSYAVFSYISENGVEYRKLFTMPAFTHENKFFDVAPLIIEVNPSIRY